MDAKTALKLNIVDLRKKCNMSQDDLAEALGTTQKTMSEIETGKVWPDYKNIQKLAVIFGVQETDLFSDPNLKAALDQLLRRK